MYICSERYERMQFTERRGQNDSSGSEASGERSRWHWRDNSKLRQHFWLHGMAWRSVSGLLQERASHRSDARLRGSYTYVQLSRTSNNRRNVKRRVFYYNKERTRRKRNGDSRGGPLSNEQTLLRRRTAGFPRTYTE